MRSNPSFVLRNVIFGSGLAISILLVGGCQTSAQTGGLAGAGIGALVGQAIGGDTKATLIGAAVGAGVGYVIGNEKDKADARTMSRGNQFTHTQVGALGGTKWTVTHLDPTDIVPPFASKTIEFRPYGQLITTTTHSDGRVEVFDEYYRIVGDTLIVNKPGYLINATFRIQGDEMTVSCERFRAVLRRVN